MQEKNKNQDQSKTKSKEIELLGKCIKALRIVKPYSNYEYFAYENNISRSRFGRYEKEKNLRFSSLVRVVKVLDMTLEEFFAEGFHEASK